MRQHPGDTGAPFASTGHGLAEARVLKASPTSSSSNTPLPPSTGSGWLQSFRDDAAFLRGFLQHPAQVGSIIPSSACLERRLVRNARLGHTSGSAQTVVELGPGTGGTTRAFLRALKNDARFVAIELDPMFHSRLTRLIRDPRLHLHLGSAEEIENVLAQRGLAGADAIISGIPFSTMPPAVSDRIAKAISRALLPGGRFVAYQVRAHVADFMRPYLGEPNKQWEVINIPPVRVFSWTKP